MSPIHNKGLIGENVPDLFGNVSPAKRDYGDASDRLSGSDGVICARSGCSAGGRPILRISQHRDHATYPQQTEVRASEDLQFINDRFVGSNVVSGCIQNSSSH